MTPIILTIIVLIIGLALIGFIGGSQKSNGDNGKNGWMDRKEQRKFLNRKNKGFTLDGTRKGRISKELTHAHTCLVAVTGAGKTSNIVVPNILINDTQSMIVVDVKGELSQLTMGIKQQQGYRVKMIDCSNPSQSLSFNPLENATEEMQKDIARILLSSMSENASDKFWTTASQEFLQILFHLIGNDQPKYNTLANAYYLANHFGEMGEGIEDYVEKFCTCKVILSQYHAICNYSPRLLQSVLATTRSALQPFASKDMNQLTSSNTVGIENLRKQKEILYLKVNVNEMQRFSTLLTLCFYRIFDVCLKPLQSGDKELYIIADEGGNLQKLPNFGAVLNTIRSNKVAVLLILQTLRQIYAKYGQEEGETILAAMVTKGFMGGINNDKTLQLISNLLGTYTEEEKTKSGIIKKTQKRLIEPAAIRTLERGEAIFISSQQLPIKIQMKQYKDNRKLRRLIKKHPSSAIVFPPSPTPEYIPIEDYLPDEEE